jgi:hypothetical protein
MQLELEPEVEGWLVELRPADFATVAFHLDRLVDRGSELRMLHSRSLGDSLFELRFDLRRVRSASRTSSPPGAASCC